MTLHDGTVIALATLAASLVAAPRAPRVWLGLLVGAMAAQFVGAVAVLGGAGEARWAFSGALCGEPMRFVLDPLAAFFGVLVAVVGGVGAVYASEYWSQRAHPRSAGHGRLAWSALLLAIDGVLVSRNGVHFLLGWELFTLAAFFLVTLDRRRIEVRRAGWLYLAASHVATLGLFAFFVLLREVTGSWELGPLSTGTATAPAVPGALFWLVLVAFGLKAGVFPLHVWLPSAHANAPSHVSAVLSGVTIKLGIYGLLRFSGWLPVPPAAGWTVVTLGVVSAVLGVAFALGQHDLKRLLAYHSVENIGIILIGVGFAIVSLDRDNQPWAGLALAGGLLHVWNHGLFKALLFLGAGSVLHATGTREMSLLGGLWRAMPWTASLFGLGAAAISGLPPLNGFVSEWLVFVGLVEAASSAGGVAWAAVASAVLLGVTGALALACFIKVCGVVFLGAPRTRRVQRAHECGWPMRASMLLLAGCCVAIGLGPTLVWPAVARAASAWRPGAVLVAMPESLPYLGSAHALLAVVGASGAILLWRRVRQVGVCRTGTWDCGYASPTPRMQYTAGSFAGTIQDWFAWILRPVVDRDPIDSVLPRHAAHYASHTPETVLDHLLAPLARGVMRVSTAARRLQHGRVQAYLLYLLAGVAATACVILFTPRGP